MMIDLVPDAVARIDALLPQTQCTRCGYAGCLPYAAAIAAGDAGINQCPPGGDATISALSELLQLPAQPLNPANGQMETPVIAWIDEARCIGCARCLPPCPVDAIVGSGKFLHTVLIERCTGCELCIAPCPVDCIELRPAPAGSAAAAGAGVAELNRARYAAHVARRQRRLHDRPARSRHEKGRGRPRHVNKARRRLVFERLRSNDPAPRTELDYRSPFELLIAVMLSAQATDKSVNKATPALFHAANTPAGILRLGVDGLTPFIKSIGLFNSKARNIIATCRVLVEEHAGEVPVSRESLERLPGVGRKTANVVLNTAFGVATVAVDTHIFRVANRTGLARGDTVRAVEDKLHQVIAPEFLLNAHHWLILHGRYVCKARVPACPMCVIEDLCDYRHKTPPLET